MHIISGSLESLFRHNKVIQEEINEKPVGIYLAVKDIGDNPHCPYCLANGAVLCCTCSGSGLYVDSILESQGIIVKVECLGTMLFIPPMCFLFHGVLLFHLDTDVIVQTFLSTLVLIYRTAFRFWAHMTCISMILLNFS